MVGVFEIVLALALVVVVSLFYFVFKQAGGNVPPLAAPRSRNRVSGSQASVEDDGEGADTQEEPAAGRGGEARRRGGLQRMRATARRRAEVTQENVRSGEANEEGNEEEAQENEAQFSGKLGKKKLEKLKKKEEKRAQREALLEMQAQRRKEEEEAYEQRQLEKQEEKERERLEAEAEKKRLAEIEEKLKKEYDNWSTAFTVEESGTLEHDEIDKAKRVEEMIEYVKKKKVAELEDLSAEFHMKTAEVVSKLQELDKSGALPGLIDDRGKFIHITEEEMDNVAKFITRRGRVSIDDIVAESNRLINLNPTEV